MPRKKDYGRFTKLPSPDYYGNYYFRRNDETVAGCVCILVRTVGLKKGHPTPYMISLGDQVLFEGSVIKEFASASLALDHIQELIDQGKVTVP
jgi:hypothetical protein